MRLINELIDAKKYLEGEGLNHDIEYRICLLLSKWFYQNGAVTREEIREQLKTWAKQHNFFFTVAMNSVAERVISENMNFLGTCPVYVSNDDINIITKKFDTYEERIIGLAVLCYAKIYSDDAGDFKLSISSLAAWLGMERKTVSKYIHELCDFNFIKLKDVGQISSWYKKTAVSGCNTYKLCFETSNEGQYFMADNDIEKLYDTILVKGDWHDIPGYNNWYMVSDDLQVRVKKRMSNGKMMPSKILWPTPLPYGRKYINLRNEAGTQSRCSIEKLYQMATQK